MVLVVLIIFVVIQTHIYIHIHKLTPWPQHPRVHFPYYYSSSSSSNTKVTTSLRKCVQSRCLLKQVNLWGRRRRKESEPTLLLISRPPSNVWWFLNLHLGAHVSSSRCFFLAAGERSSSFARVPPSLFIHYIKHPNIQWGSNMVPLSHTHYHPSLPQWHSSTYTYYYYYY